MTALTIMNQSHLRVSILSAVGPDANPYVSLLREAVAAAAPGWEVRTFTKPVPGILSRAQADVVHLHWLEHWDRPPFFAMTAWRQNPIGRALRRIANHRGVYAWRRATRLLAFLGALENFQKGGGRLVYTVHNLASHDGSETGADMRATRWLLRHADALHTHDEETAEAVAQVRRHWQGVVVIPHANYVAFYPNQISREAARRELGLDAKAFVYAFLGQVRPYKGLEELLPAFAGLPGENLVLLIAGEPAHGYERTITALSCQDPRVRFYSGFVPPERVQVYLNAADLCVLPYRRITTSGAALLALSFGLPVLAPATGGFPALVGPEQGVLYDPAKPEALTRALAGAAERDWHSCRAAILAWVRRYDWATLAPRFVALYRGLSGDA
ncbi:MAG: glycosyltransferase family 4 protein [Anaerolineae bacterium]|nr:glycosyltransferase family 4 protein [Anaerolineae bacterium]